LEMERNIDVFRRRLKDYRRGEETGGVPSAEGQPHGTIHNRKRDEGINRVNR